MKKLLLVILAVTLITGTAFALISCAKSNSNIVIISPKERDEQTSAVSSSGRASSVQQSVVDSTSAKTSKSYIKGGLVDGGTYSTQD